MFRLLLLLLVIVFSPSRLVAQDFAEQRALDRIERLEQHLNDLERQYYRSVEAGKKQDIADDGLPTGGFGVASMEVRMSELEKKMRELTGITEENQYADKETSRKLDEILARLRDVENRLNLSSNKTDEEKSSSPAPAPAAKKGDGSRSLGVVNADKSKNTVQNPTPQDIYDDAFGLLRQSKYDEAASAFESFIKDYPESALISNAYYWLGETHYVRGLYERAAVHFLKGYKDYPTGLKAPDSLLKLSMSLESLGKNEDACSTLDKLFSEFTKMPASIRQRAERERKKLVCE